MNANPDMSDWLYLGAFAYDYSYSQYNTTWIDIPLSFRKVTNTDQKNDS